MGNEWANHQQITSELTSQVTISSELNVFLPVLFSSTQGAKHYSRSLLSLGGKVPRDKEVPERPAWAQGNMPPPFPPKPQEPVSCNKLSSVSEKFVLLLDQ